MALDNRRISGIQMSSKLSTEGVCLVRRIVNKRLLEGGPKAYCARKKTRFIEAIKEKH